MDRDVKRKRSRRDASGTCHGQSSDFELPVRRDLLSQCYGTVQTLRDYILCKLPRSSRLRRKKISSLRNGNEFETNIGRFLDTSLVCICDQRQQPEVEVPVYEQFLSFSQRGDESYVTLSDGIPAATGVQAEIVDFVVWRFFKREQSTRARPKHLLCDGYRRMAREGDSALTTIPGVYSLYPNSHVATLKREPWPHLLALLGQSGQKIMLDLLVDCSIFIALEIDLGNYYQLSGMPLAELDLSRNRSSPAEITARKPSDITLVRSRIFYAKPTLTARGRVHFGYKHIHVLNRCLYSQQSLQNGEVPTPKDKDATKRNEANTCKVMMYMFPRQFGLHNVFSSTVNFLETAQKFQDYTWREEEIAGLIAKADGTSIGGQSLKLPKRLRGATRTLVQRLQILHGRCSYAELLRHYCPTFLDRRRTRNSNTTNAQPETSSCAAALGQAVTNGVPPVACRPKKVNRLNSQLPLLPSDVNSLEALACPASHVSAFCQAVLSKIIPNDFWGEGDAMCHNRAVFLNKVDHFVKLRRFESMTLHEISQGLKVVGLAWLRPPGQQGHRLGQTDKGKRDEIFLEFLYYVFDSLLIPLIRSNFYVTESNQNRSQLFYFRHDVWRAIAEPAMADIKKSMFEEVNTVEAQQILNSRRLGFSHIRLLPKGSKLRPIMNLRRRQLSKGSSKLLGPSINTVLKPVHTILKFEKDTNPLKLGSTMFSVDDMYPRLKDFKKSLGPMNGRLYFAKVDVQAAFDTIPQKAVIKIIETVPTEKTYTMIKHAEVRPGERAMLVPNKPATKPVKRWHANAFAASRDGAPLQQRLHGDLGRRRRNTVFVDSAMQVQHDASSLMKLLADHVERNLVKIGKKYYRQRTGIPQGSILSSLMCNYFYADLEKQRLGFLNSPDCLLMRLIDDFLLITLDKAKAIKFVQTMHQGVPEYGVKVNQKKTLVNFEMQMTGGPVSRANGACFPYCGVSIDCQSLEIMKDRDRSNVSESSFTVEFGRSPGQNFQRKVLNSFKIQSNLMLYDTSHNSTKTVLRSLHGAFRETALKMWIYIRCLTRPQQPSTRLITRTISKVAEVAFLILSSKARKKQYPLYSCDIRKGQVVATAYGAFLEVLSQKQSRYGDVISWLQAQKIRAPSGCN
ncbi:telomerase reverse transcriptase [Drechmeria coniospora]|uniref:Telomerase reverse transcriptase n=1 Tax=Drechmeria coniospora TaxID=98403 RepID=A0A151GES6_DRECN|nr:telomerase reverse transcriptase [Drechmeria coniospora]KYK55586.1 telomerase reverse transcriptase [Drechmeria coniospora]